MCKQPPTETDQLLPTPVSARKSYLKKDDSQSRRRRSFVIASAATLALVLSIQIAMPHGPSSSHRHWGTDEQHYKAKEQLSMLQQLTEKALVAVSSAASVDPSHHTSHHPKGKIEVLKDKKHKHKGIEDDIFHCTAQVMIMRHCDKEVKVKIHGKNVKFDMHDDQGDRHCSPKGKERSEYIASLFVDPDNYQQLVQDNAKEVNDGIPPVPMIKSSLRKVSSAAAKKKPQFPTPHHLYALSSTRPKGKKTIKNHENFREIETITPLSNKFHLDVDDRFGVNEEGDLAADYFENLSKSVTENVGLQMNPRKATDSPSEESEHAQLCKNGMTVVNWKHSRIPILARALGCGKDQGCPKKYKGSDFDTVWLLTFQYSLLLGEDAEDLDVGASLLSLESLSQSSLGHHKNKGHSRGSGNWKITAELVNEGFDSN